MKILKKGILTLGILAVLLVAVFLAGRYGWKVLGFRVCQGAGIESVEVEEGAVRIRGFYPYSFPSGFCGYVAKEEGEKLYVGFRFSGLFGVFETGHFDITIPVQGDIQEVILKTQKNEYPIWDGVTEDVPEDVPNPMEQPSVLEGYAMVIGEYHAALSAGWDGAEMMEQGLNYMTVDSFFANPLEETGYAVTDVDGDGVEELVIGSLVEDDFFGKLIFSMYVLDEEGVPRLILDSTERNRYYYAGDNRFANLGSSGWNDSFVTTLKLEVGELIDMTFTTDPKNYVQMELIPFGQWTK